MTIKQVTIAPKERWERWWTVPEELGGGTYRGNRIREGMTLDTSPVELHVPEVGRVILDENVLTEYDIPEEPPLWSCVQVPNGKLSAPETFVFRRYIGGWSAPCVHVDDIEDHDFMTWAKLCVEYGVPKLMQVVP